ncbi:MAG: hypothetical protein AAGE01_18160, partial [Pseudomonadota bacterium]
VTPYFWFSDVSLDASVRDLSTGTVVPIGDLLEKFDIGGQVVLEAESGRLRLFTDLSYIELSDSNTRNLGPSGGVAVAIDSGLDQFIADVGAGVRLGGEDSHWELIFGARFLEIDIEANLTPGPTIDSDISETDGFVGLRWVADVSDRWMLFARGDIGFGGSDEDYQILLGAGRHFGEKGNKSFLFAWRELAFEFDSGSRELINTELGYSGPVVGVRFEF